MYKKKGMSSNVIAETGCENYFYIKHDRHATQRDGEKHCERQKHTIARK